MDDDASIAFGPLRIWIYGRQFPDARDYWDGNWLNAAAECVGDSSVVKIRGNFIHLGELERWKQHLEKFQRSLSGRVELPTIEPNLKLEFEGGRPGTGHFECKLSIASDHISERHEYRFASDQSYLPKLIVQLASVLREYPLREPKAGGL
jgi:hypothetical protein